jgi:hypothetical protein
MIEVADSYEMWADLCATVCHHVPEKSNLYSQCCKNFNCSFCQVAVYASTIQVVITVSAVLVATMAIHYKELHMTADTVRAQTKEPVLSWWMRLSSVWSVPEDMEVSANDRAPA